MLIPCDGLKHEEILSRLPDRKVFGVEVGVQSGQNAEKLLQDDRVSLLLIDSWKTRGSSEQPGAFPQTIHNLNYETTILRTLPFRERVEILRENSSSVFVEDESKDFVFLDADHSYEETLKELRFWWPKIKRDGFLAGHDIDHPKFPYWGVRRALEEFGMPFELGDDFTFFIWKGEKRQGVRPIHQHFVERIETAKKVCSSCEFNQGFESFGPTEMLSVCSATTCSSCEGRVNLLFSYCPKKRWKTQTKDWSFVQKTWNYVKAKVSGRANNEVISLRLLACHGEGRSRPCEHREYSETKKAHFCGKCGCGETDEALLSNPDSHPIFPDLENYEGKLTMKTIDCPAGRF